MDQITHIRNAIKSHLDAAQNPVLMCSFGVDSMLLLWLIREVKDIPVIWLHSDLLPQQREFAERVIKEWDLTVLSYPPSDSYFVPQGGGVSLVNEYSIGLQSLPVIHDFEYSDRCALDADPMRLDVFDYDFDVTFVGTKRTDHHYITGSNVLPHDTQFGPTRLVAPLRELTDSEVWAFVVELGVPYDEKRYLGDEGRDPSAKPFCTRCLTGQRKVFCPKEKGMIGTYTWDRNASLDAFRTKFGFAMVRR